MGDIPLIRSRHITNPIKKTFGYKKGCTHIIATAQAIKSLLLQAGISENKISVIGEDVDLYEFHPNVESNYLKKEFNLNLNDKVVVNIGMIREDKGQQSYLEAARFILKNNPMIKFFIVGEGTGNKALEKNFGFC